MKLSQEAQTELLQGWSHKRPDEIRQIVKRIEDYAARKDLADLRPIASYSSSMVFLCTSSRHGPAVLKAAFATRQAETEVGALAAFSSKPVCRLYDYDPEVSILLIEQIQPGQALRDVPDENKRLEVFASLHRTLHGSPTGETAASIPAGSSSACSPGDFPTYSGWVERIAAYMEEHADLHPVLAAGMTRARELCRSLQGSYSRPAILHGDLHHDNILLGESGGYTIIDPKGVIGDPVFDIPRFIINEFRDDKPEEEAVARIGSILAKLSTLLGISVRDLSRLTYIESMMASCWHVEDGCSDDVYRQQLINCRLVERLLRENKATD